MLAVKLELRSAENPSLILYIGKFSLLKIFVVVSNCEKFMHKNFSTTKHRNSLPDPRGLLLSSIPS